MKQEVPLELPEEIYSTPPSDPYFARIWHTLEPRTDITAIPVVDIIERLIPKEELTPEKLEKRLDKARTYFKSLNLPPSE